MLNGKEQRNAYRIVQVKMTQQSEATRILLNLLVLHFDRRLQFMVFSKGITKAMSAAEGRRYAEEYRRTYQTMLYLKKNKLIKLKKTTENIKVKLTNDGVRIAKVRQIRSCSHLLSDGMYCMVAFDVPEEMRDVRDRLRRLLKRMNFQSLQRSVWVTNRDISTQVREFIDDEGLSELVHVFQARQI
jgi:CRISPR/Cas system-associated endoribonuclease Cas2